MEREAKCVGCGCTDSQACFGGCYWLKVDRKKRRGVCSSCPEKARGFKEG